VLGRHPRLGSEMPYGRLPGVGLCLMAAGLAFGFSKALPVASPMLVAIALGVVVAAIRPIPERIRPGLVFSGRTLLRAGIVLLGLQLSLRQVTDLGAGAIAVVVAVVVGGLAGSLVLGSWLRLSWTQRVLIGCGFSICGAAAVAAVDGSVEAEEEEVATAIALVVLFGTAMVVIIPAGVAVLGLDTKAAGLWVGASVHEVAQVVAAGEVIGGGALAVAVLVKLARVLMLAPVLVWIGWQQRVRLSSGVDTISELPPLVPGFVLGFIVMVALRTWLFLPEWFRGVTTVMQAVLLAAAMFALGCGVRLGDLRRAGPRPIVLAAGVTMWVGATGLAGAVLFG
jgi:uncharacterized integral membrane protein (TIGR00698 family)